MNGPQHVSLCVNYNPCLPFASYCTCYSYFCAELEMPDLHIYSVYFFDAFTFLSKSRGPLKFEGIVCYQFI